MIAVDIGSDTAVTRFNTSQTVDDGDRIAGFAALAGGFSLTSRDVTGIWDSFFPISGVIQLNGGTLVLDLDFIMHNVSSIESMGNIFGNCHRFELSPKVSCIPSGLSAFGCTVSPVATGGIVGLDDQVNSVDWSFDTEYVVAGTNDAGGAATQLSVLSWDADTTTLTEVDTIDIGDNINSVVWHPTNDWIAVGRDSGVGDELYTYTFRRDTEVLTLLDSVDLGGGGNNGAMGVAWHPDGDHLAVARQSAGAGSKYEVYPIDTAGLFGTPVTDGTNANGQSVDWNIDGTFVAYGTEASGSVDELRVYAFTTVPTLILNATTDPGSILTISWNKVVGGGQTDVLLIGRPSGTDRVQTYAHDGVGGTVTLLDGSAGTQVNSVHWYPTEQCFAAGLQDNSEGTGGELRTYSWLTTSDTIRQDDDQEISENVLGVRNSPDGNWLAIGDDGLGGGTPEVRIFLWDSAFADLTGFNWSDVQFGMHCNLTMRDSVITFSGNNVINGNGNILTLLSTVTLQVAENSALMFKDITVKGVNSNKITGLDETSTFTFQDTTFVLDNDYTFTIGKFEVIKEFRVLGEGKTFTYSSDQTSLIRGGIQQLLGQVSDCDSKGFLGCMILEKGTTLNYTPDIPNLIQLEDESSKLRLNSATLTATSSLQLTIGLLQIDGKSTFNSGVGIIWGDCVEANNLCVEILPAANLNVSTGKLIKQNVG